MALKRSHFLASRQSTVEFLPFANLLSISSDSERGKGSSGAGCENSSKPSIRVSVASCTTLQPASPYFVRFIRSLVEAIRTLGSHCQCDLLSQGDRADCGTL